MCPILLEMQPIKTKPAALPYTRHDGDSTAMPFSMAKQTCTCPREATIDRSAA